MADEDPASVCYECHRSDGELIPCESCKVLYHRECCVPKALRGEITCPDCRAVYVTLPRMKGSRFTTCKRCTNRPALSWVCYGCKKSCLADRAHLHCVGIKHRRLVPKKLLAEQDELGQISASDVIAHWHNIRLREEGLSEPPPATCPACGVLVPQQPTEPLAESAPLSAPANESEDAIKLSGSIVPNVPEPAPAPSTPVTRGKRKTAEEAPPSARKSTRGRKPAAVAASVTEEQAGEKHNLEQLSAAATLVLGK